ncbi:MAG: aminoglycoside phosphotransferase family protein [Caldilineaceae bacterium]
MSEEILSGGNLSQVVRVGDTVRRPLRSWSPTIHRLLTHLAEQGFTSCPRFWGWTSSNEILSYLPGEVDFVPYRWREEVLVAAAQLLRSYHDATVDFAAHADAQWQYVYPDASRHEVICHNDFAPYNLVFDGRLPYALIDFDMAGPGPRLRDVAYAAYWFVPLSFHADDMVARTRADIANNSRRLKLFCATYGIPANEALLDMLEEILIHMWRFPAQQVQAGHLEYQKLIDEGHTEHWRQELAAFQKYRREFLG